MADYSDLTNSIVHAMNNMNTAIVQSRPWLLFQSFFGPFIGTLFGAGIAFGSNYLIQWYINLRKKKAEMQRQFRILNASLLGLNNNINKLLLFKGKVMLPFQENLSKCLKETENVDVCLKALILLPLQIFDRTDPSKRLEFVANEAPVFLDPLRHVHENLLTINYYIKAYNQFVLDLKSRMYTDNEADAWMKEAHSAGQLLKFYEETLIKTIDSALWYIRFSVKCLAGFAKEYFIDKRVFNERSATEYEKLMPGEHYIRDYSENIQKIAQYYIK